MLPKALNQDLTMLNYEVTPRDLLGSADSSSSSSRYKNGKNGNSKQRENGSMLSSKILMGAPSPLEALRNRNRDRILAQTGRLSMTSGKHKSMLD